MLLAPASVAVLLASCQSGAPMVASSESLGRTSSRPGLGTSAGETRWSRVNRTEFFRRSSSPDAVASFHYNDEDGAKAMADQLGGGSKRSGLFTAADGRLRTGLVGNGWRSEPYPSLEARDKRIFIGRQDATYAVRLENRTDKRVEVVVTVDGLNTLSGKPASYSQHGYVLAAHQSADIDGFRLNNDKVKEFRFGTVAESKAAMTGSARNVGVIGLAVFDEDERQRKAFLGAEQFKREDADAFPVSMP